MLKFDYHTHTNYSMDCTECLDNMVKAAIKLGLTEYAITDHIDFSFPELDILSTKSPAEVFFSIKKAKEKYAGKIKILLGAEFGLRPDTAEITKKIASEYEYDLILGSAHVDDIQLEGFAGTYQFSKYYKKHEAYLIYFQNMLDTVMACDTYDILAHLDYVERYAKYPDNTLNYEDYREIIDKILEIVINKGKGIEVNTSGYVRSLNRPHPQIDIIRRYIEMGGEIITVGSDAHFSRYIACGFDKAYALLKHLGVKYITKFDKRRPRFEKI